MRKWESRPHKATADWEKIYRSFDFSPAMEHDRILKLFYALSLNIPGPRDDL